MKHVGTKGSVIKYGEGAATKREGLKWTFTPTKLFIGKGERGGGGQQVLGVVLTSNIFQPY